MSLFDVLMGRQQQLDSANNSLAELALNRAEKLNSYKEKAVANLEANKKSLVGEFSQGGILDTAIATLASPITQTGSALASALEMHNDANETDPIKAAQTRLAAQGIRDAFNKDAWVGINPDTGERTSSLHRRVLGNAAVLAAQGSAAALQGVVGLASIPTLGLAGKVAEEAGFRPKDGMAELEKFLTPEMQLVNKKVTGADGFSNTIEEILNNPSAMPSGIVKSLPSMLFGGGIGKALGLLPGVGTGVAGALGEGAMMAGSTAESIREKTPDARLTIKQALLAAGTGVIGAGVGFAGNKLAGALRVGDIDEAIVTGAMAKTPRGIGSSTVLSGAIEGGEELLQSGGETIAQNIALNRPYDEGLGNAAATGMMTGAPMGAFGGLGGIARDKAKTEIELVKTKVEIQEAAKTNNFQAFTDPTTTAYAPEKAIGVLNQNSKLDTTTPEVREANLEEAKNVMADFEDTIQSKRELRSFMNLAPEAKQAKLDGIAAKIAGITDTTDPVQQFLLKGYQENLAGLEAANKPASNKDKKNLEAEIQLMMGKRDAGNNLIQDLNKHINGNVTPEQSKIRVAEANATVDLKDVAAVEVAQKKVKTLFNQSMINTASLSADEATALADNTSNALTDPQRDYFRKFSAARIAENTLKTTKGVAQEVLLGTKDRKTLGIENYRYDLGHAISLNNKKDADYSMGLLSSFVSGHTNKANAFVKALQDSEALNDTTKFIQVVATKKPGEWVQNTGKLLTDVELKQNGGKNIHKGSSELVNAVVTEANALNTFSSTQESAYVMQFDPTATLKPAVANIVMPVLGTAKGKADSFIAQLPSMSVEDRTTALKDKTDQLNKLVPSTVNEKYRIGLQTEIDALNNSLKPVVPPSTPVVPGSSSVVPPIAPVVAPVVPTVVTPASTPSTPAAATTSTPLTGFVNHSGGAIGADTAWGEDGNAAGVVSNHYRAGGMRTVKGSVTISPQDYEEGKVEAAKAAKRNWGFKYPRMKMDELIRNWAQVKYSDAVFAVSSIVASGESVFPDQPTDERRAIAPSVTGGTGYAVGMAINHGKPVYVYNQKNMPSYPEGWYTWDAKANNFVATEAPVLTKNFAGIGSRNLTVGGRQAIKDVYAATQASLNTVTPPVTVTPVVAPTVTPTSTEPAPSIPDDASIASTLETANTHHETLINPEDNIDFGKRANEIKQWGAEQFKAVSAAYASLLALGDQRTDAQDATYLALDEVKSRLRNLNKLVDEKLAMHTSAEAASGDSEIEVAPTQVGVQSSSSPEGNSISIEKTVEVEPRSKEEPTGGQEVKPVEVEKAGALSALSKENRSKRGTPFRQRNLLADHLVQTAGSIKDATLRPLVAVKDFLSAWIAEPSLIFPFLKDIKTTEDLSEEQTGAIAQFQKLAQQWSPIIQSSLIQGSWGNHNVINPPGEWTFQDLVQFLLVNAEDKDGNPIVDLEENLKTAMSLAGYLWVAEQAGNLGFNDDKAVNKILQRDEDTRPSKAEQDLLRDVGSVETHIKNTLGQKVIAAMGMTMKGTAPEELMSRLEGALGAHILKLLSDPQVKLVERTALSGREFYAIGHNTIELGDMEEDALTWFQELLDSPDWTKEVNDEIYGLTERGGLIIPPHLKKGLTDKEVGHLQTKLAELKKLARTQTNFVRVARKADGELTSAVDAIFKGSKGTESLLNKLFSVEGSEIAPSMEPVTDVQTTTKGTKQGVPLVLQKYMKKEDNDENYLKEEVVTFLEAMEPFPEAMQAILGVVPIVLAEDDRPANMHSTERKGVEAKNKGIIRGHENLMTFIKSMKDRTAPFYLKHSIWLQQRVGILATLMNPQANKEHRTAVTRTAWSTEVDPANEYSLNNFKLRVMEAFGVKTEKGLNTTSVTDTDANGLTAYDRMINNPVVQEAVAILEAVVIKQSAGFTEETANKVKDAVVIGKQNTHTLDALIGLAQQKAAEGKPFTTQIYGEIDGVANGVILQHLVMGAAATVNALSDLLIRGGMITKNAAKFYGDWRSRKDSLDIYEANISDVESELEAMVGNDDLLDNSLDSVKFFNGILLEWVHYEESEVTKAGRDAIKNPLTTLLYGSAMNTALTRMSETFVDKVYAAIVKVGQKDGDPSLLIAKINQMIPAPRKDKADLRLPANMGIRELMERRFTKYEVRMFHKAFKETVGVAVQTTIERNFASLLESQKVFNKTAKATFDLYNAVRVGIRNAYIEKRMNLDNHDPDFIDFKMVKDVRTPIHGLTSAQEKEIADQLVSILPLVHTPMSKASRDINSGLLVGKVERGVSQEAIYGGKVNFKTPFDNNGAKSVMTKGNATEEVEPGVGLLAKLTQALDSAVSHSAAFLGSIINIHDAHVSGLKEFRQTAINLNQATWKVTMGYSPMEEMQKALERVILGVEVMLQDKNLPAEVRTNLVTVIDGLSRGVTEKDYLSLLVRDINVARYKADSTKFGFGKEVTVIDQYAHEGGQYEVTDSDRAIVQTKLDKVNEGVTFDKKGNPIVPADPAISDAIDSIIGAVYGRRGQATQATSEEAGSVFGTLGTPKIAPEPGLVELFNRFKRKDKISFREVVGNLKRLVAAKKRTNQSRFEYALLEKLYNIVPESFTITYVTKDTQKPEGAPAQRANSSGWTQIWGTSGNINEEIYVLGTDFVDSALTTELLIHELLHAALGSVIERAIKVKRGDAYALVQSLEKLRQSAIEYVKAKPDGPQYSEALKDIHEFVSWGMSNQDFQDNVLSEIEATPEVTKEGGWGNGLFKFIDHLVKLIFGDKATPDMRNGLTSMVANASKLLQVAQNNPVNQEVAMTAMNASMVNPLEKYTTQDIYASLGTGAISDGFDTHLREVINGIVNRLQGPYGTFRDAIAKSTAVTQLDAYAAALATGNAPFAMQTLASPFKYSNQEAFVAEMVAATIQAALDDNNHGTSSVLSGLRKEFVDASKRLKPQDFDADPAIAQDKYDFIFNRVDTSPAGLSQQLAQFAAMGIAHEGFSNMLKEGSTREAVEPVTGVISNNLNKMWAKVLEFFHGKMTKTFVGQPVDSKLVSLVSTLVGIENKKRASLEKNAKNFLAPVEDMANKAVQSVQKTVAKAASSKMFRDSKISAVKGASAIVSVLAADRVPQVLALVTGLRDKHFNGTHGVLMGTANYMKGPKAAMNALLQMRKKIEGNRKELITEVGKGILQSFADKGIKVSKEAKEAVTKVLLRSGAHILMGPYSLVELEKIIRNTADRSVAIRKYEDMLKQFPTEIRNEYLDQSRVLGYHLATGETKGEHLLKNAENIAKAYGSSQFGKQGMDSIRVATGIIDALVSLYAIEYAAPSEQKQAADLMDSENKRTDGGNGIDALLLTQKSLEQDAIERLFGGNMAQMAKGYTPEIYNPNIGVKVVTLAEGEKLKDLGYKTVGPVLSDPHDPLAELKQMYTLQDGGLMSWVSGIFSLTSMESKGTKHHSDHAANLQKRLHKTKQTAWDNRANPGKFDPTKIKGNFMAPVLDENGLVTNYAFLMHNKTKDSVLQRENAFDQVMGVLAGSIYDKETTKESNLKALNALHDEYLESYASNAKGYVVVGPTSPDPELRELYALLPYDTREAIKDIWGSESMKVRADMLDIFFGYRKLSLLSRTFDKEVADRVLAEKMYGFMVEYMLDSYGRLRTRMNPNDAAKYRNYSKRAGVFARRAEKGWQELVHETKDIIVVKSGATLLGNELSNISLLKLWGVGAVDILKGKQVGMKAAEDYFRDSARLNKLEQQIKIGYLPATVAESHREIAVLKGALERNPARVLIERGLMPSIVEDIGEAEDTHSYKAELARKVGKYTDKMPEMLVKAGRGAYMAHDTRLYKWMDHMTKMSDFTARYTLYNYLTTRENNPMSSEEALQEATESFVNYDIAMPRKLQYLDDMGILMFTKYFLSIQRVLAKHVRERPGKVLSMLVLNHYFEALPLITDSSFTGHLFNNPFGVGALRFPFVLDDIAVPNAMLSPFR